uniref:Uncharacterized protein n=1 Tax=Picea glauca TaxID=3330 RepID=A0A101M3X7_PICGL|nr:hypothetical protein ABT39_MTgene305 [Picea glauca]
MMRMHATSLASEPKRERKRQIRKKRKGLDCLLRMPILISSTSTWPSVCRSIQPLLHLP